MPCRLSGTDYRFILDTIDTAYAAPDPQSMFLAVFEKFDKWIGISSGVFLPVDSKTGEFRREGSVKLNIDDQAYSEFFTYYARRHPLVQKNVHRTTVNKSHRLTDYVPASDLPDTEWGRDFQPKVPIFYELSANLGFQGIPTAGLALHRKKHDRDFAEREIVVLDVLLPHLSRSLQNVTSPESVGLPQDRIRRKLAGLGLTPREEGVAALVAGGLSNRQIAGRLFISEMTVKDHLKSIFGKLGIRRRSELAPKALGLMPAEAQPRSAKAGKNTLT
ncbi:MAG: helix-turn-helix transcriptional regulator [Acidobacteriaceae bacterium]